MSKNKKQIPYIVDLDVNIKNLAQMPVGMTPAKLFLDACIGAAIRVSKQTNGLSMHEQRRLYSLREVLTQAITVQETKAVSIEPEDFKFLWKVWNDQRSEATINELIMRVEIQLKQARSRHDKEMNEN